jgi:hypothetical protein
MTTYTHTVLCQYCAPHTHHFIVCALAHTFYVYAHCAMINLVCTSSHQHFSMWCQNLARTPARQHLSAQCPYLARTPACQHLSARYPNLVCTQARQHLSVRYPSLARIPTHQHFSVRYPIFTYHKPFTAHPGFLVCPYAHIHFYAHQFLVNSAIEIGDFS